MASFIADQVGWHDAFGALLDTVALEQRYGVKRYELHRNQMHRSGRDGLLVEIAKYGLTARDLMTPVNLFTRLRTDEQGRFCFDPIADIAGRSVDLRCDMDLIVAVSSAPHPLDDAPAWAPAAIGVAAYQVGPAKQDDWCRLSSPEAERAHYNTDQFVWSAK
jgi:uncharacterized protein YcgI (DUF1989 family)